METSPALTRERPESPNRPLGRAMAAAGLLACGLLFWNVSERPDNQLKDQKAARRYWEDVSVAISSFFYAGPQADVATINVGEPAAMDYRHHYEGYLLRMVDEQGIQPWEFWRTVRIRPSLRKDRIVPRDVDDPGRPALLSAAFRFMGGAAPYLGLWLGVLLAGPVLIWMAAELWRGGLPVAGTLLPVLIACSAFMVDILTLAYSAQAFYTVSVLLLVTMSVNAALGPSARPLRVILYLGLAGCVFAVCVLGRMSTMAMLPAFLMVIALKVSRLVPAPATRRVGTAVLAMALFLTPYALVRQSRHHAVWGDIWEGLGDFDRVYGYTWSDSVLRQVLRREGMDLGPGVGVEFENAQSEAILSRLVIDGITRDPEWYAQILMERALATLSQSKLWPYGPRDGRSVAPATRPNEGRTDVYYSMASSVDFLTLGRARLELPISFLIVPTVVLLALCVFSRRRGESPSTLERRKGYLWILALLAIGAASLPVLITTASAFEVQSFALVYFTGFAFLAEEGGRRLQAAWRGGFEVKGARERGPSPTEAR